MPTQAYYLPNGTASVAAAGSNQSTAAELTALVNTVTGADGTKGVKLAQPFAGDDESAMKPVVVVNSEAAQNLKVYPQSGGTINGGSANAEIVLPGGGVVLCYPLSATAWRVIKAVSPAAQSAYTQTYSTADKTHANPTATALTDNGGGTADGTVASMAAATTLTDSSGLSGSHDDTVAAMAAPAALTENAGAIGGTNDGDLPALVDPSGDAGATVIAGIREVAARANTLGTLAGVTAQNVSDVTQKVIELVTWQGTVQNNAKEFSTQINALIADVADLKQLVNSVIDDLQALGLVG